MQKLIGLVLVVLAIGALSLSRPASASFLTPISTAFNGIIGIDHHEPTNKVVVSVHYPSGSPYNFELVASDGSHAQFSAVAGFTDEVKIATVRTSACQQTFTAGELYTGTGVDGVIARISADGLTVTNPWVSLPGVGNGLMRGSLFQDRYCSFGGDLIAVTTGGEVWRIDSAGNTTLAPLVDLNVHLEGVTTVPVDVAKYGPWSGKILAGSEGNGCIYAIDALGSATCHALGINPEDLDIIPANENFYGVNYPTAIQGAPASSFAGMVGDVLVAQEFPGHLYHVRWDGVAGAFVKTLLATVSQWEHVTFSPAGLPGIEQVEVSKRWSRTNVCFERDNDGDGVISEDPIDFDPITGAPVDNDNDGQANEDPSECPGGTAPGTTLTTDGDGDYQVLAVLKKDGTLSSYNPGQVYAVSTVKVLTDVAGLTITENYADCADDTPAILALNPAVGGGGGSVVVVVVHPDGTLEQILDANSPEVSVTATSATVTLGPQTADSTILVYVKFGPGAKGQVLPLPASCENENSAQVLDDGGAPVGSPVADTAVLEVTAKP